MAMKVHLLIGDIGILDVELALSTYGLVVVETTRPHAAQLEELARERLFPNGPTFTTDGDDEYPDTLNLLATEVPPDHGWVHYMVYSKVFPHGLERAEDLVHEAVLNWTGRSNHTYSISVRDKPP